MTVWVFDDGGRVASNMKWRPGDCAARAIAIACKISYAEAWRLLDTATADGERLGGNCISEFCRAVAGVDKDVLSHVMATLGWRWVECGADGGNLGIHFRTGELPRGRIICICENRPVAVVDGVIHDMEEHNHDGERPIAGYWERPKV